MPRIAALLRLGLTVFFAAIASAGLAANRIALVIGNSNYAHVGTLPNAAQDARDIAAALRSIGFDVHDGYDLTRIETLQLTARVTQLLASDDVALFYFAGHGVQIGAENFIIPIDADGADEAELKSASVSLQAILREMELRSERNIIVLDACRNNPFEGRMIGRSVGGGARGLARVDAGVGSYIAFSTQPGNIALDGSGRNSPFTAALLRHLTSGQDDLHELMRKVRADVVAETDGSQIPWENSSLIEQVYLAAPGGRLAAVAPAIVMPSPESVAPAPAPAVPAAASPFLHVVAGLDPNGDGFLALRSGTTSSAQRLAKMTEGTRLQVLGQDGVWFHVRTDGGLEGWAHSNWIRFVGAAATSVAATDVAQCDSLWRARNEIFHRNGYCFSSARGQTAFSNVGCNPALTPDTVPLTAAERVEVSRLRAMETSLGCQ